MFGMPRVRYCYSMGFISFFFCNRFIGRLSSFMHVTTEVLVGTVSSSAWNYHRMPK